MVLTAQFLPLDNQVALFAQKLSLKQRDTTGKRRCGHVCVEEAEHLRLVHVWTCTNDYRVDYS